MTRRLPSRRLHTATLVAVLTLTALCAVFLFDASPVYARQELTESDGSLPRIDPPIGGDDDEPTARPRRGGMFEFAAISEASEMGSGGSWIPPGSEGSWFEPLSRTVERAVAFVQVAFRFLRLR